jgi:heat shock protein HslJ
MKTNLIYLIFMLMVLMLVGCALPITTQMPTTTSTVINKTATPSADMQQPTKPVSLQTTPSLNDLTGKTWQWVSKVDPMSTLNVDKPENYTIEFRADGSYSALVDCNRMSGAYTLTGNSLKIGLGAVTRMACPQGSLDAQFTRSLQAVAIVFMKSGDLYMDLFADSGTLRFRSAK